MITKELICSLRFMQPAQACAFFFVLLPLHMAHTDAFPISIDLVVQVHVVFGPALHLFTTGCFSVKIISALTLSLQHSRVFLSKSLELPFTLIMVFCVDIRI